MTPLSTARSEWLASARPVVGAAGASAVLLLACSLFVVHADGIGRTHDAGAPPTVPLRSTPLGHSKTARRTGAHAAVASPRPNSVHEHTTVDSTAARPVANAPVRQSPVEGQSGSSRPRAPKGVDGGPPTAPKASPQATTPPLTVTTVTTPPVTTPTLTTPVATVPGVTVPSVTTPSVTVPSVTVASPLPTPTLP